MTQLLEALRYKTGRSRALFLKGSKGLFIDLTVLAALLPRDEGG